MPIHILATLHLLGRVAVGPEDDGGAAWNGPRARFLCNLAWRKVCVPSACTVQSHLEEHRLALKTVICQGAGVGVSGLCALGFRVGS